jgi:hypothetical protein
VILRDDNGDPLKTFDNRYITSNWSGYVLPEFQTKKQYVAAQVSWIVPTVTYKGHPAFSSSWVGIGGFCEDKNCSSEDTTLIQLGTEQDTISKSETDYYAWYEMLPEAEILIPTITVSPGDMITASLSCSGTCNTGDWTLSMTDETTGASWSDGFSYSSNNTSAEVIQEAPYDGGVLPLADYRKATFSATTANSASANLSKGVSVVMIDSQPHKETATSNVSHLSSTNDGFNTCFNAAKGLAGCSKP